MFKPLNNRLLVRPDTTEKETTTASGLILVKEKEEKAQTGTVLMGTDVAPAGERILFSAYGWDEAQVDGETLYLVSESSVLGIF